MDFQLSFQNRILQLTNATQHELDFLTNDLTVEWVNYNGKIRKVKNKCHLKNQNNSYFVPSGFWFRLLKYNREHNVNTNIHGIQNIVDTNLTLEDIDEWLEKQEYKASWLDPRWYQRKALFLASKFAMSRGDFATGAGKTFICYLVTRYYLENIIKEPNGCIILVVPSLQLVTQTIGDWLNDYQKDDFLKIAYFTEGQTNYDGTQNVIIGNVQTLVNFDSSHFKNVRGVIFDEGHKLALANEEGGGRTNRLGIDNISQYQKFYASIIANNLKLVYSVSGSWYKEKTREDFEATSISGDIMMSVPAHLLMDEGSLTPVDIHELKFNWNFNTCSQFYSSPYTNPESDKRNHYELEFVRENETRKKYIVDFICRTEQNQLCLFKAKDKCLRIYELELRAELKLRGIDKQVLVIVGEVNNTLRDEIKKITEENHNVVILATYGTMSTGVSINNLSTLHLVEPPKSFIWLRQSIGRMVRLHPSKKVARVLSYVDVFKKHDRNWNGGRGKNIAVGHMDERIKIYQEQKFPYTIHNIDL